MANSWTIKGKRKVEDVEQIVDIAVVKDIELHDEWMGECFLTVSVKSAEPIEFMVGDFLDYRDERYTIEYDPTVLKKAKIGSYGDGFTYDNIKFVSEAQAKIVRCDFTDIVLNPTSGANTLHYTKLPTFQYYCETVDDHLDRIQANLDRLYGAGTFTIVGMNTVRNRQRGGDYANQYRKWIDPTWDGRDVTPAYGNTGVYESVDNINCWDAFAKVHSDFGLNFIVRGYAVIVGTAGMFTQHSFTYGKGNGLYEIEKIGDSEQQIITRLRAYGNETNLPTSYYANLHKKATFIVSAKREEDSQIAGDTSKYRHLVTTIQWKNVKNAFTNKVENSDDSWWVTLSFSTYTAMVYAYPIWVSDAEGQILHFYFGKETTYLDFFNAVSVGSEVTITEGVEVNKWPSNLVKSDPNYPYPAALFINRLMLPGFPDESLYEWATSNDRGANKWTPVDADKGEVSKNGVVVRLSKDEHDPYIESVNADVYDVRPGSIYFDGTNDNADIYPTITGMGVDQIYDADTINDSGVYPEGEAPDNFKITLPNLGFELKDHYEQGAAIEMKNGMCGGRSFEIAARPKKNDNNTWSCECQRVQDSSTGLWYPYSEYQLRGTNTAGNDADHYVLTGIRLPKAYVDSASERLFDAAIEALRKNDAPRFTYQPRIDEIWMQRQDDLAKASQADDNVSDIPSIHDTLKAGDIFKFKDEDLGIDAGIIIDVLTIKENGNNGIPTYEVTLRDEKQVSTIQKIQNKIDSLSSGGNGYGGGGGGGMTAAQIDSLVPSAGENYFISKQKDDSANGIITFLKGIKIGIQKIFGWDSEGNITANNVTAKGDVEVNGLLSSLQAKINELFSSNYSGSGIFESGWLLTNNHNGHSYLEIDELLVRMKAVFMELEIRKETYSGGNVFYSPAGSIIYRVEPQNASNEPLGQRTIEKVRPWSWSRRLLGLFGLSKIGLFSHKYVVKIQDEVDPLLVHHYRCYLIADDGTVQTRNWWHDNDQARCQTFNRASEKHNTDQSDQTNPNFDDNYVQRNMDGNRFFWRLVTNVGSTKLEDGKWYDYVDLDNFTPDDGYVRGSDVPVAGDSIVCIGNRVEEERMNMIMLEVIGEDAPAIKIYKGINSFSFDGRKYMNVSPKKIQLRSGSIEYISDNGQILPPKMSRGAWVSGVRYHYYDEVSHSGSTWLCIIIDGYRWEDAQGNIIENESLIGEIRAGEGLFVYGTDSHGEDLKDRYYSIGTYDGAPAYKVRKYTINEPSDLHAAEWQKEVSAGGSGVRGSFKSRVFARTNTNIATEYYTPTGGDYERPWPGGENPHTYRGVTWYDGVPAGKEILWSSVCTFYGAGGSSEWSTPSPETDTSTLDIEFSPSLTKPLPPAVGANDTPPTTPTGTKITDPTGTHGSRANGSGSEADWYDTQKDADNKHADWENARWRAERKISNGAYDGEWVITKIKGEDGDGIPGDFKSTAFIRTNVDISNVTPTGGTYSEPWPTSTDGGASWSDGIPSGDAMLWASNCTFYGDGTKSEWDNPRKMMDTQDYDVEFAFEQDPDIQPTEPNDYNRHGSANQIWFDPILDNPLPAGTSGTWSDMVWRAERETINGEVGVWVITRIKGEKGEIDPSQIPQSWIDEVIDQASKALQEGLSIIINPQVIFVRQDTEGDVVFDNATADVEVYKSDVLQVFSIPSGQSVDSIAAYGKTDSGYVLMAGCASAEAVSNDPSHPIANTLWRVKLTGIEKKLDEQTGEYDYAYDNGYIRFKVNATVVTDDTTTPPTTTTKSYWMKVAWYLNRLGNRTTKMWGDIEQTYMSRTEYSLADLEKDQTVNLLRGTQNPQIGATAVDNNLWNNDSSQYLTIETLTETPIAGYNKAFHIGTTSAKFYQIGSFWEKTDTYRFSAYVRGVGGNATAVVEVAEPIQGGAVQTNTVAVGTEWQYVVFAITISNFNNGIDCMFRLGSDSGTVEFLAPTVVDITSPSVIRTDYEGQIESSAAGLTQQYTKAISDATKGLVTQQDFANYEQSASQNLAELRSDMENGYTTKSEFEQTSDRISFRVINGWKNYITNPVATGARIGETSSNSVVDDSVFGPVRQITNSGGEWQLVHNMDSNYAAHSGEMLTWFCVVSNTAYNNGRTLNFGTGYNLDYDCYQAVMMTANSSGVVTVSCGLGEGYFEEISYGQTLVYTNSENDKWYLCWASAKPIGTIDIRDGSDMVGFNSMTGTWKIYYAGIVMGAGCPGIDVIRQQAGIKKAGIDIEGGKITLDAENTIVTGTLETQRLDTQEVGGHRIRIEGGTFNVYDNSGNVGLRIGWDDTDNGAPYLMLCNAAGTKYYKLTYDGVKEASADFTSDSLTESMRLISSGGSAYTVHNTSLSEIPIYYHYIAARHNITGVYSNENPAGSGTSTTWQTYRGNQDGRWFTTNVISNVVSSDGDSYRISDGYYFSSQETDTGVRRTGNTVVWSRVLYAASSGKISNVGTVYYYTDISVGMWCDADGSNGKKQFDAARYIKPSRE